MDSRMVQRSNSTVTVQHVDGDSDVIQVAAPARGSTKATVRIAKRLREMLRNLFS